MSSLRKSLLIFSLASFLIAGMWLSLRQPSHAAGNTYYVATNGNDAPGCGSQSNPCRHMYYAARIMASGDTMAILPGTYADHLYSNNGVDYLNNNGPGLPPGTAGQPTTVKAANGPGTVVLQPDGGEIGGISLDSISYIVVDGLIFDRTSFNVGDADHQGKRADHITLQNSVLKNHVLVALNGIADYLQVINNKMYDNGRDEETSKTTCCPWPGYHVYICGDNQLWQGNEFYNSGGYALHFNNAGAACLTNSVITSNVLHDSSVGFTANPLRRADGQGAIILNGGINNLIYNNLFYNNNGACIRIGSGRDNKFYNNTCHDDIDGAAVIENSVYAWNNDIENNIAYEFQDNNPNGGNPTLRNNLWTKQTNPQFANASANDFHLQSSSPAINAGLTLPSVPCDFNGNKRPAGSAYDIGAYEYGSSPGGGCGGATQPTPTPTPTPPAPPAISLTATPSTLSFPGQSTTLQWTVSGATSCTASGGWSGQKSVQGGNERLTPTQSSTYTLTCTGQGGTNQASVTVTIGATAACTHYASQTPLSSIPQGFGVPWDVANPSSMLLKAECTPPTVVLKVGDASQLTYIYNAAYIAPSSAPNWTEVPLFGTPLISNAWFPANAQGIAQIQDITQPTYYVAYTCHWTGSKWMCGCRDSACTQSYWQVQKIQR